MISSEEVKKELKKAGNPTRAKASISFFKTGKGEYAAGDIFLGATVPAQRKIAKKYKDLPLKQIEKLLHSRIHEHRLVALFILVGQFQKEEEKQKEIHEFYLNNLKHVNNWDLVDSSAPYIIGLYLIDKDKKLLFKLAKSKNLWEKRVAIISTFAFIRFSEDLNTTLKISEILLKDEHHLIHKAIGWMLREVGKKDQKVLEGFLKKHIKEIPRTTLRYAIEKFPEQKRQKYLKM